MQSHRTRLLWSSLLAVPLFVGPANGADPQASPSSAAVARTETAAAQPATQGSSERKPAADEKNTPPQQIFRGKVQPLAEALERRGVRVADEMADQAVLVTAAGELIPLLADWRGRAFFQDARLRDRDVELVGFRLERSPYLHVLMVFTFDEAGVRQYTDYWCDICSIPMYEIQPCECCQGDIRLRFQPQDLPEEFRSPGGRPAGDR